MFAFTENTPEWYFLFRLVKTDFLSCFSVSWSGPYENTWNDEQCTNLGWTSGSVDDCEKACIENAGCNAFNYYAQKHWNGCYRRQCPQPIPQPKSHQNDWVGYQFRQKGEA